MKKLIFVFFIFVGFVFSANGQDKSITEFDLYGCWILERNKEGQRSQKLIYKRCKDSDYKLENLRSKFSLLAFNKAKIQTTSAIFCFGTVTENATWTFDEKNGIVQIDYMQEWLKEFKEQDPEEYAKFNSPEKFEWMKFKIVDLSENMLEVEKLSTINPKRNTD